MQKIAIITKLKLSASVSGVQPWEKNTITPSLQKAAPDTNNQLSYN